MVTTAYVWNFLRNKGLPEKSCASVMGNIYQESGFNETLEEAGNSIGYGLCQWSFGRRDQLEAYGIDVSHQLEFMWSEMTGQNRASTGADMQWINKSGYLSLNNFMSGNGNISELTNAFCFCWERPNFALSGITTRVNKANEYYTAFTGSTLDPPYTPPTTPTPEPPPTTGTALNDTYIRKIQVFLNAIGAEDNWGQKLIVNGKDNVRYQQAKTNARNILKDILG